MKPSIRPHYLSQKDLPPQVLSILIVFVLFPPLPPSPLLPPQATHQPFSALQQLYDAPFAECSALFLYSLIVELPHPQACLFLL